MNDSNEADVSLGAANELDPSIIVNMENHHRLNLVRNVYTRASETTDAPSEALFRGTAADIAANIVAGLITVDDVHQRLYDHALQGFFKVPANVFAKSCPTCDEMAMEKMNPRFTPKYPVGWELVACRRHAAALKTTSSGRNFLVGGVAEARSKAATRYYSARRSTLHAEKVAENKAAAAAAVEPSSTTGALAPPASPNTPSTSPPPTSSAEKDPCPICVEGTPNLTLDCTHSFCTPCLTTWQQNFSDTKLTHWVQSSDSVQRCYPILTANLKSRFTCPMCRTWLQYTHQSRRKRKMQNRVMRGEEIEAGEATSARSRRGGKEGRKRRARMARAERATERRGEPGGQCPEAPASMPVVQRLQHVGTEHRLHSATNGRRMRSG